MEDLEQKINQPTGPRKMSVGTKALIGVGALAGGAYLVTKKVSKLFFPPSLKKYTAIAFMGLALYSFTHLNSVGKWVGDTYQNLSKKTSIVVHQSKKIDSLNDRIKELSKGKVEIKETKPVKQKTISQTRQQTPIYKSSSSNLPSSLQKLEQSLVRNYANVIYVDKQNNELSLFEKNNGKLELVKTYDCSTGKNTAAKIKSGDSATPEGVFKFTYRNFSPELPPLYGDGMIGIDTEYKGIILCGADFPDRIKAIKNNQAYSNGGVIVSNKDLRDLDNKVGQQWSNAVFVAENPSRPIR
ncbi:MAG: L,D-transpeptidase [Nanoarchaeota archaeon]|nr:L,D-transpeptidase [Nanoarchaeota archaeon]MBU1320720.1 L,D-transpeptidase [Nanoarchaeota archaeon]MBU1598269.1 L,D-transpeptidase [Nanoarchaeota archaeon]MBU2442073.1 L,D-transpeptidase [Nanoarchaeota archaeon]